MHQFTPTLNIATPRSHPVFYFHSVSVKKWLVSESVLHPSCHFLCILFQSHTGFYCDTTAANETALPLFAGTSPTQVLFSLLPWEVETAASPPSGPTGPEPSLLQQTTWWSSAACEPKPGPRSRSCQPCRLKASLVGPCPLVTEMRDAAITWSRSYTCRSPGRSV